MIKSNKYYLMYQFLIISIISILGMNSFSQNFVAGDIPKVKKLSSDSINPNLSHHNLGLAIGAYVPGAQSSLSPDTRKVIPTIDFQYAYWVDASLGFELKSCFQSKHYSDPIVDNNDIEKELLITLSLLINIKVIGELNLYSWTRYRIRFRE